MPSRIRAKKPNITSGNGDNQDNVLQEQKNNRAFCKIIGIDFGSTHSCMAVIENGKPVVIPNADGDRITPSIVAFTTEEKWMIGHAAKRQAITNPDRTFFSFKREIGSGFNATIGCKRYTPKGLAAKILHKLKKDAELYLGTKVTEAVITVPVYFTNSQRQVIIEAGKIAGLDVKRIINEPTAAALAYGLDKEHDQKIMVYDLGGGTLGVSIIEIGDGVIEVLATSGDNRLGGVDFDKCIMDYLLSEFKGENGIDLASDRIAIQRLREAAEKAKIDLTDMTTATIDLPYITADDTGPKHLYYTLTRETFNELTADLVRKAIEPVKRAIEDSGISTSMLTKIILTGGSSRIPSVRDAVKLMTGKDPFRGVNPDECVAVGAAIQGGVLSSDIEGVLLLDVIPLSLSLETMGGVCTRLIERNTTIPTKKSQVFSTVTDNQTLVDLHVLQGEQNMIQFNKSLGRFNIDGFAPAPKGVPQIEITFDIDANGIINLYAIDIRSWNVLNVTRKTTEKSDDSSIVIGKPHDAFVNNRSRVIEPSWKAVDQESRPQHKSTAVPSNDENPEFRLVLITLLAVFAAVMLVVIGIFYFMGQ